MLYSSIDNKKIKEIKKLTQKKYRDEQGLFLVEGEHLVIEAYHKGYLKNIILVEGTQFPLDKDNIYVTSKVMNYLTELDSHQKVIGICYKLKVDKIGNHVLALDDIQDPGNLGTIIRSAVAFGCDTLILSKNTVDLYNSKVIRASQGLIFSLNIIVWDIKEILNELKEKKYDIIGTKVDGGTDIRTLQVHDKFVLVMGNEGNGVSDDVLDLCSVYAHIKMKDNCESLNVGVAASIMLYELSRQV